MGNPGVIFGALAVLGTAALGLVLSRKASVAPAVRPGMLRVELLFKPGLPGSSELERDTSRALARRAFAAVPGAFMGKLAVQPFDGELRIAWLDPQNVTSATADFRADWTHATTGPIKEDVRRAVEQSIRAYVPQLTSLRATRLT